MQKKNLGISLISLIITIIVIIILAAIVIFTGLGTPDSANFAKFASEFSDFDLAVTNDYMERYTDNALSNRTRSKAQIYYEIASGVDVGINGDPVEVDTVENLGLNILPEGLKGKEYYEIVDDTNVKNWKSQKQYYEEVEKHYVTDEGDVFFLPGYPVEENGMTKWWISENKYYISNFKGPTLADKLEIGDYVEYTPVTASNKYITNPAGRADLYTGYSSQELKQATGLTWRVIKVDERTGEVLITSTDAVNSGTYLKGAPGYLNHKNILDDICKTLYSNSELGVTARSLKVEDLDCTVSDDSTKRYAYYPNGTPAEKLVDVEYPKDSGIIYTANEHTSSKYSPYNDWTFWEYDYIYNDAQKATYTETVTIDGTTYNYTYNYAKPIEVTNGDGSKMYYPVLVSQKRFFINSGNNTLAARACIGETQGWLTSSVTYLQTSYTNFIMRFINSSTDYVCRLTYSNGYSESDNTGIYPVVSLNSTLQVDISDTTRDGSSSATAWKIIKK